MLRKVRTKNFQPAAERKCIDWKNETDLTRYCNSWKEYDKSQSGKNGKGVNLIKRRYKGREKKSRFSETGRDQEIKRSRDQEIKRSRDQKLFQGKIQTTSWEGEERSQEKKRLE